MPSFAFTARDESGRTQNGLIDAATPNSVVRQLRDRGWLVMKVQQHEEVGDDAQGGSALASVTPALSRLTGPRSVHVEQSLRQLAVMLRGGISLLAGMQTIAEQSDSKAIRDTYRKLIQSVQQGMPLSDAMEQQAGFPGFVVRLVRVGERTGIQETVLVRGADMIRSRRDTVREVTTALSYPIIVLLSAGGATLYMVTALIPKLTKLLEGLGKPLPPMTQSLVNVSSFVQSWTTTILSLAAVAIIFFTLAYLSPASRLVIDRYALRIPVLGRIFRLSGTLTFSETLGTLIRSGVTVLDALTTVQQMHANTYFASLVQRCRDSIMRGNNLADTLRQRGGYMPLLATMTAVGEESGNLDEVLEEVTLFHRTQLSALIALLSAWVTPAIIISVGVVVGYVYIAFFLGMFAIAS